MNSLKKGEGVPLLNFEGGPGVPLLNFRGVPGPTFTPCSKILLIISLIILFIYVNFTLKV